MTTSPQKSALCTAAAPAAREARLVPEMVAGQAAERPDAIAVASGAEVLTYFELHRRAGVFAAQLQALGVEPGDLVGLCLPRCLDMAVAALGIWRAGGAYVPMDPGYPAERLAFMLEDTQARVLVTNQHFIQRFAAWPGAVADAASLLAGDGGADPLVSEITPHELAYVIYTSGSTGTPKGVEITHTGLSNLVTWHRQVFAVTAADRASHLAGLGFDAAVWELWPYLASGASVHLADEAVRSSAELLQEWLLAKKVTISFVPTPIAEQIFMLDWPASASLRILLTGGDTLHHYPPANLPFAVFNNYGPTECTVVATSTRLDPGEYPDALPPIGRAIDNTEIYLLDERALPVPAGFPGEICIGGPSLARGYRNRPELTEEKFIPNPFHPEPGSRLFKTGDLARLLPDGQLAFLGRADDQIKIRGCRIEPKEVVGALNRRPEVRDSLVVAREDEGGEKRLIAYVILDETSRVTHTELRDFLRGQLPEYMLPALFVRLAAFPLTAHGKIDHSALPPPDSGNTLQEQASILPRTPTEIRVAGVLTALLKLDAIGRNDNFFLLGGHSLLGAQMIAQLREIFGVEISLRSLFDAPTVAALSAELDRLAEEKRMRSAGTPTGAPACCAEAKS
jgi:amino acid adenylation domain-containing protein